MEEKDVFRNYRQDKETLQQYVDAWLELEKGKKFLSFFSVDMEDSTAMMEGKDEHLVRHTFSEYNKFLGEILHKHRMKMVNVTPDGTMAAFEKIDQAIQAGRDILTLLPTFNDDEKRNPLKLDIRIRCGTHCGNISIENEQVELSEIAHIVISITGHLQKYAEPNTLWISDEAYKKLEDKNGFNALREEVHGHEVEVYEWHPPHNPLEGRAIVGAGFKPASEKREQLAETPAKAEAAGVLNVLMAISSPVIGHKGHAPVPLDYRKEWQNVVGVLKDRALPVRMTRLHPPTLDALRGALSSDKYDIVHFTGHGASNAFFLEDKYGREKAASSKDLADVFKGTSVKLVIFNACSTGRRKGSPAQAVHAAGVPAVIAAKEPILDKAGILLSEQLYSGLAAGKSASEALVEAKTAIKREFGVKQANVLKFLGDEKLTLFIDPAQERVEPEIIDPKTPNNIPHNVGFYGRGEELARMAQHLDDSKIRSVIVSGIGGIGKTVFATEAAYKNKHLFQVLIFSSAKEKEGYGLYNVLEDADEVLGLILGTIPDEKEKERAVLNVLNNVKCLLILDNMETVEGKNRKEISNFIKRIDPLHGAKVIIALRPKLPELEEMDGAASIEVGRLDPESCLRLMMEEAEQKTPPVVRILRAERKELASLIKAAGQHPFVIKLAVGRAVKESLSDVESSLGELSGTLNERVVEWLTGSIELLDKNARSVLRAFTVFVGSANKRAVGAVCGDDLDAESALERLTQASLLEYEPNFLRYSLHQMVLDHITQHEPLTEEEEDTYRGRAARHYLNAARELDSALVGEHVALASTLFRIELDNMRAGLKWARDKEDHELVRDYAYGLNRILSFFGYWIEDRDILEAAVESCKNIEDKQAEGAHLGNLGIVCKDLGQVERAIEYHEQALKISREIGDRQSERNQLGNLGIAYRRLGQVEKAIEYYNQILQIHREIGDKRGEGSDLGNLGLAYADLGEMEKAIVYYEQALDIRREIGDRQGEGNDLGNLGSAYLRLGEVEKAIEYHKQALKISREIGDRGGEGGDLNNLGNACKELKEYEKALTCYLAAGQIFAEIKSPNVENVGNNIARLKEDMGEEKFNALVVKIGVDPNAPPGAP